MEKKKSSGVEHNELLCPVCGLELRPSDKREHGWACRCGEYIPFTLVVDPFEGCTHGRNCNCGRERKR